MSSKTNHMKSTIIKIIAIVLGIGALFIFLAATMNYSDGFRSGKVVKISKRGTIFKTLEGQLDIDTFGAIKANNQLSQTFMFSIVKDDPELLEDLRAASLSGERVNIYYKEKYMRLFWRGDTKYFVYKIERTKT